jgi:hypothetical protein
MWGVGLWRRGRGAREPAAGKHQRPVSQFALWRRRLVADQALEKVLSIIRVRQYELKALVEEAMASPKREGSFTPEQRLRLVRAEQLVEERPKEKDRASAHELLDKLDGILPLIADDERLCFMLESELERPDAAFGEAQRQQADAALAEAERRRARLRFRRSRDALLPPALRQKLEVLLTTAVRERNDLLREERIAGELRQNYLTWLGIALFLLLAGAFGLAVLAARFGLWADVLLAIVAGALGGTLSGVIRLRAPQRRLAALKNLGLVMLVQPLLGAVGGIILFAIWRSGLLSIAGLDEDDWASVAVVAFAGGFSEPFFLKSLARITGSADRAKETQQTTVD